MFLCYKHKSYSQVQFFERLKNLIVETHGPVIVVGDLNTDLIRNQQFNLIAFFRSIGLRNVLPDVVSTTIYGTYIDICFSNCENVRALVYETYYSTHKAICMYWN